MFNRLKGFAREVGIRLGIIQQLETLQDDKRITVPKTFYNDINLWTNLHRGYDKSVHDITNFNIARGQSKRRLSTLNTPRTLSRDLSSLIFNERCDISIGSSNQQFNDYIYGVFKKNKFNSKFQRHLEFMFAQGGMVLKPYLSDGEVYIGFASADSFVPISWDEDHITEAVFTYPSVKKGKYYTLLEWHRFINGIYTIQNELYESKVSTQLGSKVPLSELYPALEAIIQLPTITEPLFVYFKPNEANNIDPSLPLGVSIYANAIDTLKSIDIAFDSLQREFRLGRKRVILPRTAVKSIANPVTGEVYQYFDETDEAYEAPLGNSTDDSNHITFIDPQLRVTEHVGAINALLNVLAMQIGVSPGTFSFDGATGLKTATEVISENSKTFRTKQSHENLIEQGIADLIRAIGQLSEAANLTVYPDDIEVTVSFDDSIIQDIDAKVNRQILLVNNDFQTRVEAIQQIFGLTYEEAEDKYNRILLEKNQTSPLTQQTQNSLLLFGQQE